jgi:tetratricopeptide (TPR) repeat protein
MSKKIFILITLLLSLLSVGYCQDRNLKADARMHYDLGNIFYQQGRFEEAQQEYQKAMDLLKQAEPVKPQQNVPLPKEKVPV